MTILTIVSSALYLAYANTLDIVSSGGYHSAAANLIESEIEIIRNMDYEDIGILGGVPAGVLPASKSVMLDEAPFLIRTFVRNIDDPFDGILGGVPNDTTPADYKLVEVQVECATCPRFVLIRSTTTVAPRNLESTAGSGNLFIQVINANGQDLPGATVRVVNDTVTPTIDLTDITGANGQLQLVGVPTSSAGYEITITRPGYSTAQTYPPGEPSNPNPLKPHVTVAQEQLTVSTFAIDETATMTVRAVDPLCTPVGNVDLLVSGAKLIGTAPDVPKYSSIHTTGAGGSVTIANLEWDAYTVRSTDDAYEIAGTSASSPMIIEPDESVSVDWLVVPQNASALLVTVHDENGQPISDASVHLEGSGYEETRLTARYYWEQSDWSPAAYAIQSGDIETSVPGILTLAPTDGPYATGSYAWLESNTVNLGDPNAELFTLTQEPAVHPPETGPDSFRVQLAANNDESTWNYIGPDGTSNTFFTAASTSVPAALSGKQYVRYRVEMRTLDETATPTLERIGLEYRTACLPLSTAHFNGLDQGTYTATITRDGFQEFTDTNVQVNADWQEYDVTLFP